MTMVARCFCFFSSDIILGVESKWSMWNLFIDFVAKSETVFPLSVWYA